MLSDIRTDARKETKSKSIVVIEVLCRRSVFVTERDKVTLRAYSDISILPLEREPQDYVDCGPNAV